MEQDEKEIRELIERWMAATKAGDTETVLSLMTDDVVFLVPGKRPFGKEAFAKASGEQADSSIEFDGKSEILELNITGDLAYTITKLSVTTRNDGKEVMRRSGHTLSILKKENGKWLLARDANLLVAETE